MYVLNHDYCVKSELPDSEILMFLSHTHPEEAVTGGSLAVHPVTYRSADGGRSWTDGRHVPEMIGAHEPAITVIDDVVFVTTHFYPPPSNAPYAGRDHAYCIIYLNLSLIFTNNSSSQ